MGSGWQATSGTAHPLQARRRGGSAVDCPAAGEAAVRLWTLDLAPAGRRNGTLGHRRCDQLRDRSEGTKKNGMTKRKIEYWVIPPEQDAGSCPSSLRLIPTVCKPGTMPS